jgi:O-antigen biosynthesis protein
VLFADVLEHLRDPGAVLRRVRPFLAEGGTVIASIPNVAHASVRLSLLAGEFRYRAQGLLDDSHLRFFTRATIEDLFEENGYAVLRWDRRHVAIDETEIDVAAIPDDVLERLATDTDATTYQFILQAAPSDSAHHLKAVRRILDEMRVELEELRPLSHEAEKLRVELEAARHELEGLRQRELAELRPRLEELEAELVALRRAHEVRGRRLVAERVAFAEGIAHVQAEVYGSRSWRITKPLRAGTALLRRFRG